MPPAPAIMVERLKRGSRRENTITKGIGRPPPASEREIPTEVFIRCRTVSNPVWKF